MNDKDSMPNLITGFLQDAVNTGMSMLNSVVGIPPPVNIRETADNYEYHIIAPALSKEDFQVTTEQNTLHISFDKMEDNTAWLQNEYNPKSFKKSFTLNNAADISNISAAYTAGVLIITIPKTQTAANPPQNITIT